MKEMKETKENDKTHNKIKLKLETCYSVLLQGFQMLVLVLFSFATTSACILIICAFVVEFIKKNQNSQSKKKQNKWKTNKISEVLNIIKNEEMELNKIKRTKQDKRNFINEINKKIYGMNKPLK